MSNLHRTGKSRGRAQSPTDGKWLLIVEEDRDYGELLKEATQRHSHEGRTSILYDIESAMLFLRNFQGSPHSPLPSLILLDLGHSQRDRFLRQFRSDIRFASIPVAVMVPSDDPKDLRIGPACGASGYVVKPDTLEELATVLADLACNGLGRNGSITSTAQDTGDR